jgi:hypothetical protein
MAVTLSKNASTGVAGGAGEGENQDMVDVEVGRDLRLAHKWRNGGWL